MWIYIVFKNKFKYNLKTIKFIYHKECFYTDLWIICSTIKNIYLITELLFHSFMNWSRFQTRIIEVGNYFSFLFLFLCHLVLENGLNVLFVNVDCLIIYNISIHIQLRMIFFFISFLLQTCTSIIVKFFKTIIVIKFNHFMPHPYTEPNF